MPTRPKLRNPATPKRPSARTEAFTRLADLYANRTRVDDAQTDLALAMEREPTVTPGLREAPGGLPAVLNALRAFDHPDARAFLTLYDSLSKRDRDCLRWEEIAVAADVSAARLFGLAAEALVSYGTTANQILLWGAMPRITKRIIKTALTAKGIAAQEMAWKAGAVLPLPKGAQIALQQVNLPAAPPSAPELPPWDQQSRLRAIQEAWGDAHQLPPKPHEPLPSVLEALQERTTTLAEEQ